MLSKHNDLVPIIRYGTAQYFWNKSCCTLVATLVSLFFGRFIMLPRLNAPEFFDALIGFIEQFVPSLDIHRLHIYRQTSSMLQINVEMSNGQILYVVAKDDDNRIHLQLDYGSQRVELWMFSKNHLQNYGVHNISMNGILSQNIDKNPLQIRGESSFFNYSLIRLASEMGLTLVELKQVLLGALGNVSEQRILILDGDIGENSTLIERDFPIPESSFHHTMLRPCAMDSQFEQTF